MRHSVELLLLPTLKSTISLEGATLILTRSETENWAKPRNSNSYFFDTDLSIASYRPSRAPAWRPVARGVSGGVDRKKKKHQFAFSSKDRFGSKATAVRHVVANKAERIPK